MIASSGRIGSGLHWFKSSRHLHAFSNQELIIVHLNLDYLIFILRVDQKSEGVLEGSVNPQELVSLTCHTNREVGSEEVRKRGTCSPFGHIPPGIVTAMQCCGH